MKNLVDSQEYFFEKELNHLVKILEVWPLFGDHKEELEALNKKKYDYSICSNEQEFQNYADQTQGIYCREFCHFLDQFSFLKKAILISNVIIFELTLSFEEKDFWDPKRIYYQTGNQRIPLRINSFGHFWNQVKSLHDKLNVEFYVYNIKSSNVNYPIELSKVFKGACCIKKTGKNSHRRMTLRINQNA